LFLFCRQHIAKFIFVVPTKYLEVCFCSAGNISRNLFLLCQQQNIAKFIFVVSATDRSTGKISGIIFLYLPSNKKSSYLNIIREIYLLKHGVADSTVTRLQAVRSRNMASTPIGVRDFSFLHGVQTGPVMRRFQHIMGTGALSLEEK
jgi:hypothetical protein